MLDILESRWFAGAVGATMVVVLSTLFLRVIPPIPRMAKIDRKASIFIIAFLSLVQAGYFYWSDPGAAFCLWMLSATGAIVLIGWLANVGAD
jgi:hypothetical protein